MKEHENDASLIQLFKSRNNSKYLLNFMANGCLAFLFASLLGFAFMLILQGIIFLLPWFALIWQPAFNVVALIIGADPKTIVFKPIKVRLWLILQLIFHFGLGLFLIWHGMKMLIDSKFLGQNLIWWLIKK